MCAEQRETLKSRPVSITSIVVGAVGCLCVLWLLLPAIQTESSRGRSPCKNNLKQIGLALHEYHETCGSFPPAYLTDAEGNPTLSWRVLILQYLDDETRELFHRFDLTKPWNAPENLPLLEEMPSYYRCPEQAETHPASTGVTHYLAITGPNSAFPRSGTTRVEDFTDGTTNCVMVAEDPKRHVPWTAPHDVSIEEYLAHHESRTRNDPHTDGQNALFADGSVRFLWSRTSNETLRRLLTINDGKPVDRE